MERMKPMNSESYRLRLVRSLGRGWGEQADRLSPLPNSADFTGKYDAINVLIYWTDTAVLLQSSTCERRKIPANGIQRINRSSYPFLNLMVCGSCAENMPKH